MVRKNKEYENATRVCSKNCIWQDFLLLSLFLSLFPENGGGGVLLIITGHLMDTQAF